MKTHDIAGIAMLKKGALTVCVSESTGTNISVSLKTAEHLCKTPGEGSVLYLNTVQTSRQLADSIRMHTNRDFDKLAAGGRISWETSPVGLLLDEKEELETEIKKKEIAYVIINSWDFASKDHRRKLELIYLLNSWMERYGMTVLVFAERMKNAPVSQKIQRGLGVGKLAAVAQEIKVLREESEAGTSIAEDEDTMPEVERMTEVEGRPEWNYMQRGPIVAAYQVIHGEQKKLEDEGEFEFRWRIHDLAEAEGLVGKDGWLKWDVKHILKQWYELTNADRKLLEALKAARSAEPVIHAEVIADDSEEDEEEYEDENEDERDEWVVNSRGKIVNIDGESTRA